MRTIFLFIVGVCLLIAGIQLGSEIIVWLVIAVFGAAILNELQQQRAPAGITKSGLNLIISKLEIIMNKQERLDKAIADLNGATNDIAADLVLLKDQIAAGTVSEESIAALETNIAVLQSIGNAQ